MARWKRPSEYRFLKFLYPGVVSVAVLFFLDRVENLLCAMPNAVKLAQAVPCVPFPAGVKYVLLAVVLYSILRTAWVVWRDFYRGEYYLDLEAGEDRYKGWWI